MKVKNHEVEVRARLTALQRRRLLRMLKREATFKGNERLTDVYLCPASVTSFREIEMDEVGSYSLRLRRRKDTSGECVELNTKTITRRGDHNAWEEHEVTVDSFDEAIAIFKAIGFKSYFVFEKSRSIFRLRSYTVLIEDIAKFGPTVEIEIMASPKDAEQKKQSIYRLLEELGIKKEQTVRKSITNLLMKERASFT